MRPRTFNQHRVLSAFLLTEEVRDELKATTRLIALTLAALSGPIMAEQIKYTGPNFQLEEAGAGRVTATFTFHEPLINLAILDESDIAEWSMSAAGITITYSDASFFEADFVIGSDGLPELWEVNAESFLPGPVGISFPEQISTRTSRNSMTGLYSQVTH